MNKILTINVLEEDINYLEEIQLELESRKQIVVEMLQSNGSANKREFNKYHKSYQYFFKEFNELKNEIANKYIPDEYKNDSYIFWDINYNNKLLTLYKNEKNGEKNK